MDSFLKIFRIQLFSKVLYVGRSLCTRLKFGICDIYFTQIVFLFYVNFIWYNRLITSETIIWLCSYVKEICFILENFVLLLSHFLVLFSQRWSNADEQTQLSFSTKYKSWNSIDLSTLNQRNYFNVVSTLFYQRWNNVDKYTSAQLSFSTKFHHWNVVLSTLNRCNSIDVVSTLFCQRWNNVDTCTSAQLSFSTKYQRRDNVDERWRSTLFQRWINVDVFAG